MRSGLRRFRRADAADGGPVGLPAHRLQDAGPGGAPGRGVHPDRRVVAAPQRVGRDHGLRHRSARRLRPADRTPGPAVAGCAGVLLDPRLVRAGRDRRQRYVDGGAWSATSVDLVAGLGLDEVFVIAPMVSFHLDRPDHLLARLERTWRVQVTKRCLNEVEKVRAGGPDVTVLGPGAEDLAAIGGNLMDHREAHPRARDLDPHVDRGAARPGPPGSRPPRLGRLMRAYIPVGWAQLRELDATGRLGGPLRLCTVDPTLARRVTGGRRGGVGVRGAAGRRAVLGGPRRRRRGSGPRGRAPRCADRARRRVGHVRPDRSAGATPRPCSPPISSGSPFRRSRYLLGT